MFLLSGFYFTFPSFHFLLFSPSCSHFHEISLSAWVRFVVCTQWPQAFICKGFVLHDPVATRLCVHKWKFSSVHSPAVNIAGNRLILFLALIIEQSTLLFTYWVSQKSLYTNLTDYILCILSVINSNNLFSSLTVLIY